LGEEEGVQRGNHILKWFPLWRHSFAIFSVADNRKDSRGGGELTNSIFIDKGTTSPSIKFAGRQINNNLSYQKQ